MPHWDTSCPDWEDRIIKGESLIPFPPLFPEQAAGSLEVLRELKIVDAPGSPTIGESCAQWTDDLAGAIFGANNPDTGEQLIKEIFLLISKKNSKSTLAAAIMLTVLIQNWRQSAEFIILAPTKEVADNAYAPARDMVKKDPELDAMMQVQDHLRTITHLASGATLKVVAADTNTVGGKKAAVVLVDEIHLFGANPKAESMLLEATGGLASRPEGFVIYLTTQSDAPPAGVFKSKLLYARKVRDGVVKDPQFLPVLYEFPKAMVESKAYLEPENFYITNPNLGYSVSQAYLERGLRKAQETGEPETLGFLAKHLNVEIGMSLRSDRWAGADYWAETADTTLSLKQLIERSEVIDIGIDGGGLDDLLGLTIVGRCKTTRDWLTWSKAWAHPSVLTRHKQEAARFQDFERDRDLVLVTRIGDDVAEVGDICEEIYASGLLDKIGVDQSGIGAIYDELMIRQIPEDKIVGVSQGWKLGGAIKTAERKIAEGKIKHAGQPLMAWCVGNARVEPRANSIMITKQASGSAKIDPLMAFFNAVTLMALDPPAAHKKFDMFFI